VVTRAAYAIALIALASAGHAHAQDESAAPETPRQEAASPETAEAPEVSATAEAQALFRRGLELGEQDRWAEALELFRRSLALVPRPSTLFNIGFALFRMGRFVQAIASFDAYLALPEAESSELRVEATRRREEALASLATLTLELTPADARVLVDGEESDGEGPARTLSLDPGRHVVRASAEGFAEGTLAISVLAAEHATQRLVLVPLEEPIVTPPTSPGVNLFSDPTFWAVTGGLLLGAAVAVGVGVGVGASGPGPYGGSTGVVLIAF
jgi:tetratricopeptide (TPR) repeat protein